MLISLKPSPRKYMFWKYIYNQRVFVNTKKLDKYIDIRWFFDIWNDKIPLVYPEIKEYSESRNRFYDMGRINYFMNNFEFARDPIIVDGTNEILLIDGRHRLAAAVINNIQAIQLYILVIDKH